MAEDGGRGRFRATRPDREGDDERTRCAACRELYPHSDLDRRLWCPPCRDRRERWTRIGSHATALAVTVPFGAWVALEASTEVLSIWAWLLPLGVAYYLGWRIGRELSKGLVRRASRD